MAKRFRYYLRQGWHTVNVDRANVWNWNINGKDVGNEEHFKELNEWCNNSFPKDSWISRYRNWHRGKEFVFREEKHANWFKLKWL